MNVVNKEESFHTAPSKPNPLVVFQYAIVRFIYSKIITHSLSKTHSRLSIVPQRMVGLRLTSIVNYNSSFIAIHKQTGITNPVISQKTEGLPEV